MADEDPLVSVMDAMQNGPMSLHAQQIGFLCIYWSSLELQLGALVWTLMEPVAEHTAAIAINTMDLKGKISAALALGFHKRPSDAWFDTLKESLDTTDNSLRPERNRFVHDYWAPSGEDIFKLTMRSGVYKKQAREYALKLYEIKKYTSGDIFVLCVRVLAATGEIMKLRDEYLASPSISS